MPDTVEGKIKQLISNMFDVAVADVTMESKLIDTYSADSLDYIDICMELEEAFEIELPENPEDVLISVGDIVNIVTKLTAR